MEGIRFKFTDENGPGKIIKPESLESVDALTDAFEHSLDMQATSKVLGLKLRLIILKEKIKSGFK